MLTGKATVSLKDLSREAVMLGPSLGGVGGSSLSGC